jgi:hypothetical protein
MRPERQRSLIRAAQRAAHLSTEDLWLRYFALGGTADLVSLEAFLAGALDLETTERDRVAAAVNEHLDSLVTRRAPYSTPPPDPHADGGALAALVALLYGTHLEPPESIPHAVDEAALRLGVHAVVYLVDDDRETLVPMPGVDGGGREPLSVDGTVAGMVFRTLQAQGQTGLDRRGHLWVPIIDGIERLGVLDVMVATPGGSNDPTIARNAWWLAHYLGHLLAVSDRYGDALRSFRGTHLRSVQAELVWQLLPPLTAGTDRVLISGRVEPNSDVGGDAFDYALSADHAWFALVDAVGHDLESGLSASTTLAALRAARRAGLGLFAQVETIHRLLQGADRSFATAVVGQLDLNRGRLRYIAAGHPYPLLMRHGRVVKQLRGGRRALLGLEPRSVQVGQEDLEPDDTIVLYTDGITEAHAHGDMFGLERFVTVLEMMYAEHAPLPEVVRRSFKAVLEHEHGRLQDDATMLLVQWTQNGQALLRPPSDGTVSQL